MESNIRYDKSDGIGYFWILAIIFNIILTSMITHIQTLIHKCSPELNIDRNNITIKNYSKMYGIYSTLN